MHTLDYKMCGLCPIIVVKGEAIGRPRLVWVGLHDYLDTHVSWLLDLLHIHLWFFDGGRLRLATICHRCNSCFLCLATHRVSNSFLCLGIYQGIYH